MINIILTIKRLKLCKCSRSQQSLLVSAIFSLRKGDFRMISKLHVLLYIHQEKKFHKILSYKYVYINIFSCLHWSEKKTNHNVIYLFHPKRTAKPKLERPTGKPYSGNLKAYLTTVQFPPDASHLGRRRELAQQLDFLALSSAHILGKTLAENGFFWNPKAGWDMGIETNRLNTRLFSTNTETNLPLRMT